MPTIIDWPDNLRPASVDWGLVVPQRGGRSTFDGSEQSQTLGAPRWAFTITTGPMRMSEGPQWAALMRRLRGRVNRLRVWNWEREAPFGPGTGTPTVRVASNGASLQTQGWTPSVSGILLADTYFSVNGELKSLSQDISSDSSGRATITFEPPLRAVAPVDAPLLLVKPTALFILTTERPSVPRQGARLPGTSYSFEEAFA